MNFYIALLILVVLLILLIMGIFMPSPIPSGTPEDHKEEKVYESAVSNFKILRTKSKLLHKINPNIKICPQIKGDTSILAGISDITKTANSVCNEYLKLNKKVGRNQK